MEVVLRNATLHHGIQRAVVMADDSSPVKVLSSSYAAVQVLLCIHGRCRQFLAQHFCDLPPRNQLLIPADHRFIRPKQQFCQHDQN